MQMPPPPRTGNQSVDAWLRLLHQNQTRLDEFYYRQSEHAASSSGATDAGKPTKLDSRGKVSASLIAASDIDQSEISGTDEWLAGKSSDDVSEGSNNLYFSGKQTDDLTEGETNFYFTDERAQDAVGDIVDNGASTNIRLIYASGSLSAEIKNGQDLSSLTVITNVQDDSGIKVKYRTLTITKGGITAISSESDWTATPL